LVVRTKLGAEEQGDSNAIALKLLTQQNQKRKLVDVTRIEPVTPCLQSSLYLRANPELSTVYPT
jgi:hypothetical protein